MPFNRTIKCRIGLIWKTKNRADQSWQTENSSFWFSHVHITAHKNLVRLLMWQPSVFILINYWALKPQDATWNLCILWMESDNLENVKVIMIWVSKGQIDFAAYSANSIWRSFQQILVTQRSLRDKISYVGLSLWKAKMLLYSVAAMYQCASYLRQITFWK